MPSLGSDMESGKLVEWLVEPGDPVHRGDVVAVVETDKGAIEVEIFEDGIVEALTAAVGDVLPVGAPMATIAPLAAPAPAPPAPAEAVAAWQPAGQPPAPPAAPPPAEVVPLRPRPASSAERIRVTPAARREAQRRGIELAAVTRRTGLGGAIRLADLPSAPSGTATRPARRGFDAEAMRRTIGAAMARAKREIPHYYLTQTVSLDRALARLDALNRTREVSRRVLPAALILRAVARGLAEVPELNGTYVDGAFRPGSGIHVGWAIALRGGGLVAPAIHDADRLSLDALMAALRDLVQRARLGGLRSSELADATITVTSLGERGAETVLPVIYPPQVAILGVGRIVERPWVENGALAVRSVVTLGLAADHRVSDGHRGGLLLAAIEDHLESDDVP